MARVREPLPPYPRAGASRLAADRSTSTLRTVRGLIESQRALMDELDAAFADAMRRRDEQDSTRARITALARSARGRA